MDNFLVKLLLVGFIGISVFGFLAMGHDSGEWCLASAANRSACPTGISGAVSFYANAFKSFSLAIVSFGINFVSFVFALALILSAVIIYAYAALVFKRESFLAAIRFAPASSYFSKINFSRWLSLHENSPSFI